ncbi:MAG: AraC family transcriptional regulator [Schaedlerella sp.]|nr:AraC family transcriptional regulator [Clostridiales bacterium]MDY4201803.1 AraC family transcriptional regulator [Schaedlerella sp.]
MLQQNILSTKEIHISKIISIHYFESVKDFIYPGGDNNFWEFQYVDKGELTVTVKASQHLVKKGQIVFFKPKASRSIQTCGKKDASIISILFECRSPAIKFFEDKILNISEQERNLLVMIIEEARKCVATPLDNPNIHKMEKRTDDFFGSKQLLRIYLEEFLLYIIRRHITQPYISPLSNINSDSILYNKILRYLESHIREPLTIDEICTDNLISRSQLQKLFQKENQCGIIEFFSQMKIEFAKQLIRENQLNFTQISDYLGYSSIHYFSRQFKKIEGITPSAYAAIFKAPSADL